MEHKSGWERYTTSWYYFPQDTNLPGGYTIAITRDNDLGRWHFISWEDSGTSIMVDEGYMPETIITTEEAQAWALAVWLMR